MRLRAARDQLFGPARAAQFQQKLAHRCQGLCCHSRLAIEFCSGGAHGWQRAVRSAHLRATSRQLLRRAYHRPPPHSIPALAPCPTPSLGEHSLDGFLCALCVSAVIVSASVRFFSAVPLRTLALNFLTLPPRPKRNCREPPFEYFRTEPKWAERPIDVPTPHRHTKSCSGLPKVPRMSAPPSPNAHERPAPPPAAPPFLPQNFDYKSFTSITLMPSINASFLTSAPRGSIDS